MLLTKVISFYRGQLPNTIQIPGSLSQSWSSLWENKFRPLPKNSVREDWSCNYSAIPQGWGSWCRAQHIFPRL